MTWSQLAVQYCICWYVSGRILSWISYTSCANARRLRYPAVWSRCLGRRALSFRRCLSFRVRATCRARSFKALSNMTQVFSSLFAGCVFYHHRVRRRRRPRCKYHPQPLVMRHRASTRSRLCLYPSATGYCVDSIPSTSPQAWSD